jgi:hypothetical protein
MTIASTEPLSNVRVVGSNYTTFLFDGLAIAYLEEIADSGQKAIGGQGGEGYEFIHPLGYRTPTDIVTARVLGGGFVDLTIHELWNQQVWEQLSNLTGSNDIVTIFEKLAATSQYVTMTKVITPPTGAKYGKVYHRCVIVTIEDGESVSIGALSVAKQIRVAYTHSTPL